jgi:hypothetical protein
METREEVLRKINWDYTYTVEDQEKLLASPSLSEKKHIYVKILQSVRWYTIKSILNEDELREVLSPEVIGALFPPAVREKYHYARKVLFG